MSERDELTALAARVDALESEARDTHAASSEAHRLLAHARLRARMPVLDNLKIASPCSADWDKMVGDERARFCAQCEKNVYNLSSMTRAAAEALLIEKEGRLCVRYFQRADGTILTADCPDGLERRRRKNRVLALSFGAMSAAVAAYAAVRPRAPLMGAPPPLAAMPGDPGPKNIGVPPEAPTVVPIFTRPTMGEAPYVPPRPKVAPAPRKVPPKPPEERMLMGDISDPSPGDKGGKTGY